MNKSFNLEDWKDNSVVMHCKTEEEAISFCNYLHNHGRKWISGTTYSSCSKWDRYKEETCYYFNIGCVGYYSNLNNNDFIILEWSDYMTNNLMFFKKLPNNFTGYIHIENGKTKRPELLDKQEKEYLSAVIKPFREKVTSIIKHIGYLTNRCFIEINLSDESISLPYFDKQSMYIGMDLNRQYSLEELCI